MSRKHKEREQVYAILRVDEFHGPETQIEDRITVKEILRDRELAELEVERLNRMSAKKGCHYWWQETRLFAVGRAADSPND